MDDVAIALIIAAELAVLLRQRRLARSAPALMLFRLYLVAAQAMAWLVRLDLASHEMLDLYGGTDRDADLLVAIIAAAVLFLATRLLETTDWRAPFQNHHAPASTLVGGACATVWAALFLTALSTLDLERLWAASHYLDLTDPAIMTRNALPGLALGALPLAGAAAAAMAAILIATPRHSRPLAALLLLQAAVTTIWLLAAHSRAAALAPAAFTFFALVRNGRGGAGRLTAGGLAILIALAGALAGRNSGEHGLGSLAHLPEQIARTGEWAPRLAGNVTEGIFAVAAGIGEWRAATSGAISFPDRYVWLSFSPMPSAIDGFAHILDAQVRLHAFAPMPGYVELAWFGPVSQLAFIALIASAVRMNARAARMSTLCGAVTSMLLMACLYLMAAYPVRTALKPLWLSLALSTAATIAAGWRSPVSHMRTRQADDAARHRL